MLVPVTHVLQLHAFQACWECLGACASRTLQGGLVPDLHNRLPCGLMWVASSKRHRRMHTLCFVHATPGSKPGLSRRHNRALAPLTRALSRLWTAPAPLIASDTPRLHTNALTWPHHSSERPTKMIFSLFRSGSSSGNPFRGILHPISRYL